MKSCDFLMRCSALSGGLACIMEFVMELYAASKNPDYNSISQSISYLGNPESPTFMMMKYWSVIFSIVFVFFAIGFFYAFKENFRSTKTATLLLIIYGLGQGLGAGIFAMDALESQKSWSHFIHDICSGFGDLALVLFPLVMLLYFIKIERYFTLLISIVGLILISLFLSAKFELVAETIPYKGLWQRLFQGVYYLYFLFIAYKMYFKSKISNNEPSIS